jgi:hypothetical protein
MGNYFSSKSLDKLSIWRKFMAKGKSFRIIILMILIVLTGCATQHKYKKYKAVPCPCEKENKR